MYRGRFAPSPTGPLHAGSLVAALASWLDARAQGGRWIVRIEDTDTPRCIEGGEALILGQLAACGLHADEPVQRQSRRDALYQAALDRLVASRHAYACGCSRADIVRQIADAGRHGKPRHGELVYPGTCRDGLHGKTPRAVRLRTCGRGGEDLHIQWHDRRTGPATQNLTQEVGDFVLKRADGLWSYQLAVVVDDADQRITHVVRGDDLADNTPRQIHLQRALGHPTPQYLHTPLVLGPNGEKLSKQNGAQALELASPTQALRAAAAVLGLPHASTLDAPIGEWLPAAAAEWRAHWAPPSRPA